MSYDPVYISAIKVNETAILYYINNTKDQDYVQFCKLIVIYDNL